MLKMISTLFRFSKIISVFEKNIKKLKSNIENSSFNMVIDIIQIRQSLLIYINHHFHMLQL